MGSLAQVLRDMAAITDPDLLVSPETFDDAGVYRLTDEIALVSTADFITPPVNDPFVYGQIAAANAISDVYAMGGRPITCLNLVAFPSGKLSPEVLHRIVAGAVETAIAARSSAASRPTLPAPPVTRIVFGDAMLDPPVWFSENNRLRLITANLLL